MKQLGVHALISLFIYLISIGFSFQAMKAVQVEKIIRRNHTFEAQIFLIFSAIALGYLVGGFVIALMDNSLQLSNLF